MLDRRIALCHPSRHAAGLLASALAMAACSGDTVGFEPGDARLLSTDSPTKDEDPSVLRTRDGTLLVAWFSDRGGNPDIYLRRASDGDAWSPPIRVTTHGGGDFYPNLLEDEQGTIHLVWFRWSAPFVGNIWHNSSSNSLTWNPDNEELVTRAFDVDDWVPTIAEAPDGTLLVYLVSAKRSPSHPVSDIYLARKPPGASEWNAVQTLAGLNSAGEHDHLPFAARIGDGISMVWVRHDTTQAMPWLNPTSTLFYATSADGVDWSTPSAITDEPAGVANLFPQLYADLEGAWSIAWLSTKFGSPRVLELPWEGVADYPQGLMANTHLPQGYSHRIAPTSTPGVYLGVWVQGPDGAQDIYYRFFER